MMNRLRSLSIPARVAFGYLALVIVLGVQVLPHAGRGGGLEFLWLGLATFPTSMIIGAAVNAISPPDSMLAFMPYILTALLVLGGAVQAWIIYKLFGWIEHRKSRQRPS
ncbi:hypothetical protein ACFWYW_58010 [Nonomuraea sp. NPDC059023]|uniref:SCO4225 family membrane protein n=1 Tax=unclassified Nonomuraea TaxID=2593643 RepID=UPI003675B396